MGLRLGPNLSPYQEDSDSVSAVSSYCDVRGGSEDRQATPLCILSPDCELYICDGDDDDSTDRWASVKLLISQDLLLFCLSSLHLLHSQSFTFHPSFVPILFPLAVWNRATTKSPAALAVLRTNICQFVAVQPESE